MNKATIKNVRRLERKTAKEFFPLVKQENYCVSAIDDNGYFYIGLIKGVYCYALLQTTKGRLRKFSSLHVVKCLCEKYGIKNFRVIY